jgi:hypothetical protein
MPLVPRATLHLEHHTCACLNVHEEHRQTVSFAQSQEMVDFCAEIPLDCIQLAIVRRNSMTKVIGHDGIARTNLGRDDAVRVTSQTCTPLVTREVATSAATTYRRYRSRA